MSISAALTTGIVLAQGVSEEAADACKPGTVCDFFLERTDNEFASQLLGVAIPDILRTIAIVGLAWFLVRVVRKLIRRVVRDMVERDRERANGSRRRLPLAATQSVDPARAAMRTETLGTVLRSVASIIIWGAAIFVATASLDTVAIDLGPLIAGAGIVGVALGFGAQSLVKDFLTGLFMLIEDQYGVGDIVDVGPATGVVEGITLRTTRLRDIEGVLWHVPNGQISRIGNLSQQWSRSVLDIPVAYSTDLNHAIDVIKRTADELWRDRDWRSLVLEEPDVWGVEEFGDSAILVRVVLKVVPAQQWAVSRELRIRIKAAFDVAGIEIPFNTYSVFMRSDDDSATTPFGPAMSNATPVRSHRRARTGEYDSAPPDTAQDHGGDNDGNR